MCFVATIFESTTAEQVPVSVEGEKNQEAVARDGDQICKHLKVRFRRRLCVPCLLSSFTYEIHGITNSTRRSWVSTLVYHSVCRPVDVNHPGRSIFNTPIYRKYAAFASPHFSRHSPAVFTHSCTWPRQSRGSFFTQPPTTTTVRGTRRRKVNSTTATGSSLV